MPPARLHLKSSHEGPNSLINEGNNLLANGEPQLALPIFTKVLGSVCPGHIPALLNRSTTYVLLGYPDLAAFDAYVAASLANEARLLLDADQSLRESVYSYVINERATLKGRSEKWVRTKFLAPPSHWLGRSTAALPLSIKKESAIEGKDLYMSLLALEIKALYRLIGSLYACGGGAISDALGLVDDVLRKEQYELGDTEKKDFHWLGQQLTTDMCSQHEEDPRACASRMKSKRTLVHRVKYPWNKYEPDSSLFSMTNDRTADLSPSGKTFVIKVAQDNHSRVKSLRLVASRNIHAGEKIFQSSDTLCVSTVGLDESENFFCDNCTAALIRTLDTGAQSCLKDQSKTQCAESVNPNDSMGRFRSSSTKGCQLSPSEEHHPKSDSDDKSPKRDFLPCRSCWGGVYCSAECWNLANEYHEILCGTHVESGIRKNLLLELANSGSSKTNSDGDWTDQGEDPRARCIYSLLLVRILASATQANMHPLEQPQVQWLNGGLHEAPSLTYQPRLRREIPSSSRRSWVPLTPALCENNLATTANTKTLPWSFMNNVVLPIRYMRAMKLEPFFNMPYCDGTIINTLYAKIYQSTRITPWVRHAKVFDECGGQQGNIALQKGDIEEEVWVGSLHHLVAMLKVKEGQDGDYESQRENVEPNVRLGEGSETRCFAIGTNERTRTDTAQSEEADRSGLENPDNLEDLSDFVTLRRRHHSEQNEDKVCRPESSEEAEGSDPASSPSSDQAPRTPGRSTPTQGENVSRMSLSMVLPSRPSPNHGLALQRSMSTSLQHTNEEDPQSPTDPSQMDWTPSSPAPPLATSSRLASPVISLPSTEPDSQASAGSGDSYKSFHSAHAFPASMEIRSNSRERCRKVVIRAGEELVRGRQDDH
ncbi:hypothetical protein MMC25_001595 [Agyrium rufum]|nr:hypothetical protein [Agyrium rufum]